MDDIGPPFRFQKPRQRYRPGGPPPAPQGFAGYGAPPPGFRREQSPQQAEADRINAGRTHGPYRGRKARFPPTVLVEIDPIGPPNLLEMARADWQRNVPGSDPLDAYNKRPESAPAPYLDDDEEFYEDTIDGMLGDDDDDGQYGMFERQGPPWKPWLKRENRRANPPAQWQDVPSVHGVPPGDMAPQPPPQSTSAWERLVNWQVPTYSERDKRRGR